MTSHPLSGAHRRLFRHVNGHSFGRGGISTLTHAPLSSLRQRPEHMRTLQFTPAPEHMRTLQFTPAPRVMLLAERCKHGQAGRRASPVSDGMPSHHLINRSRSTTAQRSPLEPPHKTLLRAEQTCAIGSTTKRPLLTQIYRSDRRAPAPGPSGFSTAPYLDDKLAKTSVERGRQARALGTVSTTEREEDRQLVPSTAPVTGHACRLLRMGTAAALQGCRDGGLTGRWCTG